MAAKKNSIDALAAKAMADNTPSKKSRKKSTTKKTTTTTRKTGARRGKKGSKDPLGDLRHAVGLVKRTREMLGDAGCQVPYKRGK